MPGGVGAAAEGDQAEEAARRRGGELCQGQRRQAVQGGQDDPAGDADAGRPAAAVQGRPQAARRGPLARHRCRHSRRQRQRQQSWYVYIQSIVTDRLAILIKMKLFLKRLFLIIFQFLLRNRIFS